MSKQIAVLGAGSWGSILANLLDENGHSVRLWSYAPAQVAELNEHHTNQRYVPDFHYSETLTAYSDLATAIDGADVILFVVPTKAIRSVAHQVADVLAKTNAHPIIVHASKGLEQETHKRLSQVLAEEIPVAQREAIVVLSGPSHAEEVARKDITLITAASDNEAAAETVQQLFMNDYFRIYTNTDVVGVELGAALKNIIALGAGALHGLGYGDDAKAALMTRGLAEISRLGVALGANPLTFIGLSGVGDLIVTATSVHSRNWRAGNELGSGQDLKTVIDTMGMVIEGIPSTKAAYELAQQQNIEMPITEAIYDVLYKSADIKEVIPQLMRREGKPEIQ
ncbi:NAD(P)H-dependent glycerol-3-phosphate dehydrogenase [Lactobacillus pentosus]|jgi:glycerol-3-phosphate dehydrogenase (NAD(P)+)|uniref:Glycerol-3-phosphate dehydrogenase [NAD(P)+] n=1 Tax=Lactiplantibacillus pentosus TaxID=1589 RepID=A0A2S9VHS0_LACPE|nr:MULTISPECIES: NAD(P)H-dependent glycerol-3-phosphate dehydrogenase [Lactiplantibacillus]MCH4130994.1 NAD(P)H-dependent glycerol-3-phosphate dehydrogenase [Lactiplantibacillus sp.]BBM20999.1 NAD(P)H-dependent glycerol-3-phosphate dehydrogenase [Lactiplantibacillus plantarum]MBQ0836360.1 NAD(P)H-dependent glycerol-3-phosphate dehydrogenase [Lactiplantibacillus pentosus]MBU7463245.1 NAD(P)H-dependent glycerol-3-phosphate dehydrogenase [Lactiplantibacillus pentosus]MBU7474729.1 NAD(P)H-dependen